jgi:hypothetical protein
VDRHRLDLGNFLRTVATPEPINIGQSLTSLKDKLIKTGAKS